LLKEKNPPALSEEEERVLSALRELGEAHVTELSAAVGVPVFKLYGLLSALEVKNLAARLGGNRFAPV
jgi:sugar-specific transcriptional regulator TrmB